MESEEIAAESRKSRAPRVNYKKLHKTGKDEPLELEDEDGIEYTGSGSNANKILGIFSDEEKEDDKEDDEECVRLQEELRVLEKEEEKLKRQKKVEDMRRKVEENKLSVKKLRGETSHSVFRPRENSRDYLPEHSKVNMKDVRKDKVLRDKAKKVMRESGLDFLNEEESDSSSSSEPEKDVTEKSKKKISKKHESESDLSSVASDSDSDDKKTKKKRKSGILARPSDHVKHRQIYPQAYLRFEHVNSKVSFEKLEFNLFVAGELEIISSASIKKVEKEARLELLKRLMYLNSSYDYATIKSLYAAILREIELGKKSWGMIFNM